MHSSIASLSVLLPSRWMRNLFNPFWKAESFPREWAAPKTDVFLQCRRNTGAGDSHRGLGDSCHSPRFTMTSTDTRSVSPLSPQIFAHDYPDHFGDCVYPPQLPLGLQVLNHLVSHGHRDFLGSHTPLYVISRLIYLPWYANGGVGWQPFKNLRCEG
jgi:hypothetical protein